jgi:uncharacterized membrane protein YbaN (DUF454 family)
MSISLISKWFLVLLGTLALGLGIVGIFVPLLPTTPFLLAAAACYLRSSERMYGWLLNHRWFGSFISNYRQYRAITKGNKILALALLWGTIGYSTLWGTRNVVARIFLLVIAVGVTVHVLSLRTWKDEMTASRNGQGKGA